VTSQLSDDRWRRSCESTSTVRSHDLSCASDHRRSRGSIINTSSLAGVNGATGLPRHSAAKVEIIGFTQSVAKEAAGCT
jgi:NAD(P)-dependent dehydrogenase (short-subunit alcohol dehydrogenase family)